MKRIHFKLGDVVLPMNNKGISVNSNSRAFVSIYREYQDDENDTNLAFTADTFINPEKHKGYAVVSEPLETKMTLDGDVTYSMWRFLARSLETGMLYLFDENSVLYVPQKLIGSKYIPTDNSFATEVGTGNVAQVLKVSGRRKEEFPDCETVFTIMCEPYKKMIFHAGEERQYEFVNLYSPITGKVYSMLYNRNNVTALFEN